MTIADINTLARFLVSADTVNLTAANLLILVNKNYEEVTGKILTEMANANWQYGDANYTAFPTYTFNMTNGTSTYDLDTSLSGLLTVMGVEVKDQNGIWHLLKQISMKDITLDEGAVGEYYKTSGIPHEYELRENEIVLYPAPDNGVSVTLTAGCRIFFLRGADVYTSAQVTTGTKVPGFPSPWHDILAYGAAYDFAVAKGMPNANQLKQNYDIKLRELLDFMAKRNQGDRPRLTTQSINFR